MEIIKNSSYEILNRDGLAGELMKIEKMGRISHWSEVGPITMETAQRFVRARMYQDHHINLLEHGNMSVIFRGISIGMTRENNRHRPVSLVERSTRFVDYDKGKPDLDRFKMRFVNAPDIDLDKKLKLENGEEMTPREYLEITEMMYRELRKEGYKPDSARQYLPIGLESEEGETTNFRQWRHIFTLRTAKPAHWEIRQTMGNLLEEVKTLVPVVFEDFEVRGQCVRGVNYYDCGLKDE
jgi:thymidylate synthase (FAD)